ncbi:MAG TPA: hypothetical protein VN655_05225 [Pseudolabrys sp.]|nr:hypothetical protein [Pseudolabrys sp.]
MTKEKRRVRLYFSTLYGSNIVMAMDVEAEIHDLKRRVGELEGSFGFLAEQVKGVHKDLLRFEQKTDRKLQEHDGRFDRLDGKVDAVGRKVDSKVEGLAKALPIIVADTLRDVLREDRGKK